MILANGQIKRLRAAAHRLKLKPVVIVGQKGLSENLHHEIEAALAHHELIKLRIPALCKDEQVQLHQQICKRHNAALISRIGNVIVIYRANDTDDRFASVIGG